VYSLISEHPHIFSGFYQYEGFDKLLKRKRVGRFEAPGRRTLERNPHDI